MNTTYTSPLGEKGWHAAGQQQLSAQINAFIETATSPVLTENIIALILPHAGYAYSGQTAAFGVKPLIGHTYQRVLVIGPSHKMYLPNKASVPTVTTYVTDLGTIHLDQDFIQALKKHSCFTSISNANESEHSIFAEIPFLQQTIGAFKLVPIVIGSLDAETAKIMADILLSLIDENTLIVISSDFMHYGSAYNYVPFTHTIAKHINDADKAAYEYINKKDANGFNHYCDTTGITICGRHPINLLIHMLPSAATAHLLHYITSGEITQQWDNSVSYLAAAFTGTWSLKSNTPLKRSNPLINESPLSVDDQRTLLAIARQTIDYYFKYKKILLINELGITVSTGMNVTMGAFVTLKKQDKLRGCIGEIFPRRPLIQAVMEQAINAAVNDDRFPTVQQQEMMDIEIEISALTMPHPVKSYNDIILGHHGIVLQKNNHSAVFLPQVASEQQWTLEETLSNLAQKAGLNPNDWQQGASFTVFEAIIFHENKGKSHK